MRDQLENHVKAVISISDSELQEFTSLFQEVHIKKKDFLIEPGQLVEDEYYVVKGCLIAYYEDSFGEKHIIQFAIEDWWISDFEAFFGQETSKLYIQAIEDSHLLGIKKQVLETLYQRIPAFERFFRIKTTNSFVALRRRILSTLEKTASERYVDFCTNYPEIEKRVNNYNVANYLGIKPESLSRIRKQLALNEF